MARSNRHGDREYATGEAHTGSGSRSPSQSGREALRRVTLDGFQMVISELEVEQAHLRRVKRYLEE
jgi:hypothetical protein